MEQTAQINKREFMRTEGRRVKKKKSKMKTGKKRKRKCRQHIK